MTIKAQVNHTTHYKYDRPVELAPQTIRLRPSPHNKVPISNYSFRIFPENHFINWYQDIYGNFLANVVFPERINEFKIDVSINADINIINPFDFFLDKKYEKYPFYYENNILSELRQYLEIVESGELLNKFISELKVENGETTLDLITRINRKVNESLGYVIRLEAGVYACEEILTKKQGSCRDMAWLLCQIYRHLGIAARFVSGYSIQLKADEKPVDGPSGVEEDIVDLHAWTEIYIPGAGWIGLDPTSGMLCGEGHIPLCASPNTQNAAPVSGLLDYCESTMDHKMEVIRIHEDPRTTKPFSPDEWADINKLGEKIDKDIKKHKINLTVGGEPTFISTENRDEPEWNIAALGAEKREKATELLFRLKDKFTKGASLHFGQGKWYGGEPLPRWAFGCYWRVDGEPIWKNESLFFGKKENKDKKSSIKDAKKLLKTICSTLNIPDSCVIDAYEDLPHYALKERLLPLNKKLVKDPKDKEIQKALSYSKGELGQPKGFVLPLIFSITKNRWISNKWKFKAKNLFLIPGDSALGYRLPLASLPYINESSNEIPPERSTLEKLPELENRKSIDKKLEKNFNKKLLKKDTEYLKKLKNGYVRTALTVELRDDNIHVFIPPTYYLEHYIELVTAIEFACEKCGVQIQLEGYEPAKDSRAKSFLITPDPGVIEVNIHPSSSWRESVEITETLYEEAKQTYLTAEKFLIDGRRTGTGGGNHITIGGKNTAESPWLRKPDLLKSVITYWQNHPGLSYLFSSQFIGPTSQAPRIDEARNDSLYELEIAFKQIDKKKDKLPLFLLDRLLRNILVDLTGNTHRAEISIDKLYTSESERGRLGLLEFRGFEMTPHARMNLIQILLIKAIVTKFWQQPYSGKLKPLGTLLHDKYMLPYYVWQDFSNVLNELKKFGYNFDPSWFQNQFDFRFPLYGKTNIAGAEIELRMALEPWPVLGEENISGATSRGVDSAVERLEVRVKGLDENKYKLTCNKFEVPLKRTDTADLKIAGIRYKGWEPVSTLHPNLPINTPLVFDIVDIENKVSVGGFRYHLFHPGGRNYDTSPVNVNEAEGRVLSRFEKTANSSKKIRIKKIEQSDFFPYTLDLRRG